MKAPHILPTRPFLPVVSGILALVMAATMSSSQGAVEVVPLRLGGKPFGNGKAINVTSGANVISPSKIYHYKITGKVRGKFGALKRAFPVSSSLVRFVDSFDPGASSSLKGSFDNPSSALPVSLLSHSVSGVRWIRGFGKVRVKLLIASSVNANGEVVFEVKDVLISNKSGKLKGTMVFRSGKVVVHTAPVISFQTGNHSVDENGGAVQIVMTRTGFLGMPATVQYATSNDSALAGTNYEAATGQVVFAANETEKTISIPLIDNTQKDKPLLFNVTLSGPSAGAVLGQVVDASVRIMNDDK